MAHVPLETVKVAHVPLETTSGTCDFKDCTSGMS